MQITITKKDFLLITKNLFDIGKKENRDIYLSLNETRLKLSIATEDNLTMTTYPIPFTIKAVVNEFGECILPQKVFETIKNLITEKDDEITIKANDNEIIITHNTNTLSISTTSVQEWKEKLNKSITYINKKLTTITISPSIFMNMYQQTVFASANTDFRTSLTGVLLETNINKIKIIAGDGYRVSVVEEKESDATILTRSVIPKKAFLELKKYLKKSIKNLTITIGETFINFTCDGLYLSWKLIADTFPDYAVNIPELQNNPAVISTNDIVQYIKEIDAIKSPTISFTLQPTSLEIATTNSEFKQVINYCSSTYVGEGVTFKMDTKHLLEYLSILGDGEIQIHTISENKPVLFKFTPAKTILDDELKYTYVFSPVR